MMSIFSSNSVFIWIILIAVACVVLFIGMMFLMKKRVRISKTQRYYIFLAIGIIIVTAVILQLTLYMSSTYRFPKTILYLTEILFAVYLGIICLVLVKVYRANLKEAQKRNQEEQMVQLQQYVANVEQLQADVVHFQQDYVEVLANLETLISNGQMEELAAYFDANIMPVNKSMVDNKYKLSQIKNMHVLELKGLLAAKMMRAQELKIDAQLEIVEPIETISMYKVELCQIVGILLDNAIEASEGQSGAFMKVAFVKNENTVTLLVQNSLPENMPEIHQMFEKGFSTKGENRGLGLSIVRGILNKNPSVVLDTQVLEGEAFMQGLVIRQ
ncbi:GHKL domain-containing protein [Listeria grandensis]|uniref:GHKL domain-containing protein n=1 Tax=Listeria grandensis TaxID=1494963 RepID=A0A7X1CQC2_9LIST|nr:GHKL domain-containing protein [Listeria grandensis]MBC1474965.1 GHKL domain-containing protein [Listeria grandensis]MBC1936895.1 GHKL domain-containing protein [Listeria grandensis]